MNADPDQARASAACDILKSLPPGNQFRILVIDDEPANRMILRRLLNAVGYAVMEAENGASGLAQLVSSRPDLVIVDMEMPILNGAETVVAIRQLPEQRLASLPVIAASGNPTPQMETSALESGADVWMTKPFDFPELQGHIARLLEARRRRSKSTTVDTRASKPSTPAKKSIKL